MNNTPVLDWGLRFPASLLVWSEPHLLAALPLMHPAVANNRRLQVLALCVIAALAAIFAASAQAASYPSGFEERTIAPGLTGPVGVAWTPDGRMLLIEKDGRLKVAPAAGGAPTTVLDITGRVNSYWDRGLLGVAVDSDFANNHYIYLLYTYDTHQLTPDGSDAVISRLSRFELSATNQVVERDGSARHLDRRSVPRAVEHGRLHPLGRRLALDRHRPLGPRRDALGRLGRRVELLERRPAGPAHLRRAVLVGQDPPRRPQRPRARRATRSARPRREPRPGLHQALREGLPQPVPVQAAPGRRAWWSATWAGTRARRSTSSAPAGRATAGRATRARSTRRATARPRRVRRRSTRRRARQTPTRGRSTTTCTHGASRRGPRRTRLSGQRVSRPAIATRSSSATTRQGFIKKLRVGANGSRDRDRSLRAPAGPGRISRPRRTATWSSREFGDGSPGTGSLKRIVYTPGNAAARGAGTATPTSGAAAADRPALECRVDPTRTAIRSRYAGTSATAARARRANPAHTYSTSGVYTATLTVSDGRGLAAPRPCRCRPEAPGRRRRSSRPTDESLYRDGDTITMRGSAHRP